MHRFRLATAMTFCVGLCSGSCTKDESTAPADTVPSATDTKEQPSAPVHVDSDAQPPPTTASTDTTARPVDETGSVDPELPSGSPTFDDSYFGVYKSYPPEQASADKAPLSIELVDAKQGELMGGITVINARLATASTPSMEATFKFDPRREGLSGYAIVDGNGVRMRLAIKEVRSGYDLKVDFTTYEGETAKETGTFSHGYRRNR